MAVGSMDKLQHSSECHDLVLCVGQMKSGTNLLYSQFIDCDVNLNLHDPFRSYNLTSKQPFDLDTYLSTFRSNKHNTFIDVYDNVFNTYALPLISLRKHFNIRIVYSVRDPVEQYKSHYAMSHEYGFKTDANLFRHEINLVMWQEDFDTFVLFLEDLKLKDLQHWLGFSINLNHNIINPGKKHDLQVSESFESTYTFFKQKYGKEYIESIWPNSYEKNC